MLKRSDLSKNQKNEIPTKEEYIKIFKKEIYKRIKDMDTKENIEKYIDGINYDSYYKGLLISIKDLNRGVMPTIWADAYNLYMLYPDY